MQTTTISLNTNWRFQELPNPDVPEYFRLPWLPAKVPGHVHLDLLREGAIPNPFERLHEHDVEWVDDRDWVYETTFHLDSPLANARLIFHGLDTIAEIALNDVEIGLSDNMFIAHEFDASSALKFGEGEAGSNTLRVTFRSAKRIGLERQEKWNEGPDGMKPNWFHWPPRSFVRKAQYMYGWDWGPILISCGIWQSVELVSIPTARLTDWQYSAVLTDPRRAVVTISADVERAPEAAGATLEFSATIGGNTARTAVAAGSGRHRASVEIAVHDPKLWQPHESGSTAVPALYDIELNLTTGSDMPVDARSARIGLRSIELVREPDSDGNGEGFKFRVNGVDTFAKGANWIPNDSFPASITRESLLERLVQARDVGFNMLRVWGGGLYESEDFYDICDELGIMVWQDFPYACAYYPDTGEYAEAARVEGVAAVRRIRNHASLALWCGNNENLTMYQDQQRHVIAPRYLGEHIYDEVLPAVVAAEDPATDYWPSSPAGGKHGNSADFGDCHNWDVWHGRGDWVYYTENDSRFCSEFGFAASCGLSSWNTVLAESDRAPRSPAVKWHDKTRKGYEKYLSYTELHFPTIESLDDLVYYTQLNQAEAFKFGVEHYRRRKGRCWGTLFWQFNDCWPTQSWAVVDYLGDPKAAYFACKRFYAQTLVSLVRKDEIVTAHLVNDNLDAASGVLTLRLRAFGGEDLAVKEFNVTVGSNSAAVVAEFDLAAAAGKHQESYVCAEFRPSSGEAAQNILFLAEPKDLTVLDPGISTHVERDSDGRMAITVRAKRFAPYVWLHTVGDSALILDDNFFHLQPGETRRIKTVSAMSETAAELESRLEVRYLGRLGR